MGKNSISLGKRILLAGVVACVMVGFMAISGFAYGLSGNTFSVDATNPTVTVGVTGAEGSQITIVVRTAGDAWLTDPNNNVVFIDQVTGTAGTKNITFGVDSKFLVDGSTYDIFVGGSGQQVAAAKLNVGDVDSDSDTGTDPGTPSVASFVTDYDEAPVDGKVVADVTLSSGNGEYIVSFNNQPMLYSTERNCYVGVVAEGTTAASAVITAGTPENFVYGDIIVDEEVEPGEEVDSSDLLGMKLAIKGGTNPARFVPSDVDVSGAFDSSDLLAMKLYIGGKIVAFPAISK